MLDDALFVTELDADCATDASAVRHINLGTCSVAHACTCAEQRAIAEVLGALDDKIAANTESLAIADDAGSRVPAVPERLQASTVPPLECESSIVRQWSLHGT